MIHVRQTLALVLIIGCRSESQRPEERSLPARTQEPGVALVHPTTPPTDAPGAAPRPWFYGAWRGSYVVELHTIERPARQTAWLKDDGKTAAGEGSLEFRGDERGNVVGSARGPLGEARLSGTFEPDGLGLALGPLRDAPDAFAGFAACTRDGDALECTLAATSGDGNRVRKGRARVERQRDP